MNDTTICQIITTIFSLFTIVLDCPEINDMLGQYCPINTELLRLFNNLKFKIAADKFIEEHKHYKLTNGEQRYVKNGYANITFTTIFGNLFIRKPRIRDRQSNEEVKYLNDYMEDYSRTQYDLKLKCFILYMMGMGINDISSFIKQELGDDVRGFSPRNIINIFHYFVKEGLAKGKDLFDKKLNAYYVAIYIDATYIKVRGGDKMCILAAVGLDRNNKYVLLGLQKTIDNSENEESYRDFLNKLKAKGLERAKIFVADGAKPIWNVVKELFPESKQQRCVIHVCRNIFGAIARKKWKQVGNKFSDILNVKTAEEARILLGKLIDEELKYSKKAKEIISKNIDIILTYFDFDESLRSQLYTSNPVETVFSMMKPRGKKTRGMMDGNNIFFIFQLIGLRYGNNKNIVEILNDLFSNNAEKMKIANTENSLIKSDNLAKIGYEKLNKFLERFNKSLHEKRLNELNKNHVISLISFIHSIESDVKNSQKIHPFYIENIQKFFNNEEIDDRESLEFDYIEKNNN